MATMWRFICVHTHELMCIVYSTYALCIIRCFHARIRMPYIQALSDSTLISWNGPPINPMKKKENENAKKKRFSIQKFESVEPNAANIPMFMFSSWLWHCVRTFHVSTPALHRTSFISLVACNSCGNFRVFEKNLVWSQLNNGRNNENKQSAIVFNINRSNNEQQCVISGYWMWWSRWSTSGSSKCEKKQTIGTWSCYNGLNMWMWHFCSNGNWMVSS